jgi:hypothetical protein
MDTPSINPKEQEYANAKAYLLQTSTETGYNL